MNAHSLLTIGLATAAVGLGGCGADPEAPGSGALHDRGVSAQALDGNGPVDAQLLIDRTSVAGGDAALSRAYKAAALDTAARTIARGGRVSLQVFARVGARSLTLYEAEIPTLEEAGPAARDDAGQTAALDAALDVAVGLAEPQDAVAAEAIERVTDSRGSDVDRVVGQAIDAMAGGEATVVFVASDGWVDQSGHRTLAQMLRAGDTSAAVETLTATARSQLHSRGSVSLLRMTGLGYTAGRPSPDSELLDKLTQAWQSTCERLPVDACDVTARL